MQELLRRVLKVWEKRAPLTPAQLQALGEEAYARGWGLAGIWEKQFLEKIQNSLGAAIAKGSTYSDWTQNEAQKILDAFGAGVSTYRGGKRWDPWYSELVMRNATQASFAGGRYSAEWAPEWQQIAPFWRYYATLDDRTRPTHAALHGKVFRKDDPAARSFLPPWGHSCRCQAIFLTLAEVEDAGYPITAGHQIPYLPIEGGGMVGRPPGGWGIDRFTANGSRVLTGATKAPPPVASKLLNTVAPLDAEVERLRGEVTEAESARWAVSEKVAAFQKTIATERFDPDWAVETAVGLKKEREKVESALADVDRRFLAAKKTSEDAVRKLLEADRPTSIGWKSKIKNAFQRDSIEAGVKEVARMTDQAVIAPGETVTFKRTKSGDRANYAGSGTIALEAKDRDSVVVHEMGHWLEEVVPGAHAKCVAFLHKRTAGENAELLSALTGNKRFKPNEIAKKDKFLDVYTGKIYSGDAHTEILSMGLQSLLEDPKTLAKKDPEFFDFIIGILRGTV